MLFRSVYVSIIPFVKDVNVGPSNYNASWIDWSDWNANNGSCSKGNKQTQSSCLSQSGNPTWTPDNHNTWNGCITDRDQDYDTKNTTPTGTSTVSPTTLFPAEQYGSCPVAMMGMNYNWTAMSNLVDSMTPDGRSVTYSVSYPTAVVAVWDSTTRTTTTIDTGSNPSISVNGRFVAYLGTYERSEEHTSQLQSH